jgi:hypothetical protein
MLVCVIGLVRSASAQLVASGRSLTVTTANATASFIGPDLVGFVNALTNETYLTNPSIGELARVNGIASAGSLQSSNWTIGVEPGTGHPIATITGQEGARNLTLTVKIDPVSQEVVLRLSGSIAPAGLRDASWSIAGLNIDAGRLIVPAHTGVVFDKKKPGVGYFLQYPNTWHAQMAVFEAAAGSMLVYSTDTQMQFKQLRISTRGNTTIDVALATEAVAPYTTATTVPAIEWRLRAFSGDWRNAADVYRTWLITNRPPTSIANYPWVSNIRTVVILPADQSLLAPLASILTPSKTLLYLPDWRQFGYDVNYPDYTPRADTAAFIAAAHALGFKVMLHLDLIGVSPGNPDYAGVQAFHVRTSESLEQVGWRWEMPPSTPYRFAYINPAAPAFRSLFITRVAAGLNGLGADAIHLDISAPMMNDGNGPIGGLNYGQGSVLLHQELAAAFPTLALGGEGQNDILYRFHSFAQSWAPEDDPLTGHPIANFLFNSRSQFYGHLGQPIAREGIFTRVLLQLERRGITPALKLNDSTDLDTTLPENVRLFTLLQSWQTHMFQPSWSGPWNGALVRHQGLAGATAAVTDSANVTTLTAAGATLVQHAHDTSAIAGTSFVRYWPAFDADNVYGLDPELTYFVDPIARPTSTHVTSLPSGIRVGSGSIVGSGFAHVQLLPPKTSAFNFEENALVSHYGVRYQNVDGPLAFGAVVNPQSIIAGGVNRSGFFIHPPYQGQIGGETFAEFQVPIPAGAMLQFSVAVADNANCTDGVTFHVGAAGTELWRQHVLRTGWQDVTLNLANYAGTTIPIRLTSHPGPANNPSCDWAVWSGAKVIVPGVAAIAVPLALAAGSVVSGFDGSGTYSPSGPLTGTVNNVAVPGHFTLFTQNGAAVSNGANLVNLPFQTWLWPYGEPARPGSIFGSGAVRPATSGGVTKTLGLWAHPPNSGATRLTWLLRLPDAPFRFSWSAAIADGGVTDTGVEFVVRINGVPYWRMTKQSQGWSSSSLDLSPWRGQNILLELVTDALVSFGFDWAYWADLTLTTSPTTCTYSFPSGASIDRNGGTFSFAVTATATCPWNAISSAPSWLTPMNGSGISNGTVTYTVAPNPGPPRTATISLGGQTFTVNQSAGLPTLALEKTTLRFAATTNGATFISQTTGQLVRLTQLGAGAVTWTASSNQPWLQVNPPSGTGTATHSIDLVPIGGLPIGTTVNGTITIAIAGAANAFASIAVSLDVIASGTSASPFGFVDTPLENRTGVTGAVPFTGWALDDIEVARVTVCRAAFGSEAAVSDPNCGGAAEIFLGTGVFIDGSRPDVQAAFPAYPRSSRGGFGLMVLTNMLPNQGNGTYVFSIYAFDREGHVIRLGTRTMTCDNAHATKPFGAIDTPGQGASASGAGFLNFGWALTQANKNIPTDGSTIQVVIDGVSIGSPSYNHFRPDIASLFPGLANTNGAVGFKTLDTTTMTNGLHTIVWVVTDSGGATDGIGSRYFTVSNGAGGSVGALEMTEGSSAAASATPSTDAPVFARRGWDPNGSWTRLATNRAGRLVLNGEEIDRFELWLGPHDGERYSGHLRVGDELAALPVGSQLDSTTGWFTWSPGAGFVGGYDLVFVRWAGDRPVARHEVRIVLQPKSSNTTR